MKIAWKIVMVIAVLAFAVGCQKLEVARQFRGSDATLVATSSTTTVAVAAADSLEAAITFSWNDPKYAVGLEHSKFTVMVGATGENFVVFASKDFDGALTGSLSGKDVNGMALKLGGSISQPIVLDAKVISSQLNNNEQLTSNIMQITVTPYGDLSLSATSTSVVCSAATSGAASDTLSWTTAFVGYSGVKTYELQYAAGGTNFATPTIVAVTSFSKTFSQLDMNKIALANGVSGGSDGDVDFRLKATNESGTVVYSNTVTINISAYVANNSIGIIGDATPGGWGNDTDLRRPDPINHPGDWTITVYLTGGLHAKFRADDTWTGSSNWGSGSFPSGTAVQDGPDILVSNSGYYKVDLNVGTGAFSFAAVTATTYTSVSLIGDFDGWNETTDLDLTQGSPHIWTGTVVLPSDGGLKIRANHAWAKNWGGGFPSAYGVQDGPNITVAAGTYFVYINDVSGEYFFGKSTASNPFGRVGVIGDATPNGWGDPDSPLIQDPSNPYKWSGKLALVGPDKHSKFRADNGWTVNWGAATFPNGAGTQDGSDIPTPAGTYQITFNSATGEYTFTN